MFYCCQLLNWKTLWSELCRALQEFLNLRKEGKLLFGQLPLLEIDGLRLVQSQVSW